MSATPNPDKRKISGFPKLRAALALVLDDRYRARVIVKHVHGLRHLPRLGEKVSLEVDSSQRINKQERWGQVAGGRTCVLSITLWLAQLADARPLWLRGIDLLLTTP